MKLSRKGRKVYTGTSRERHIFHKHSKARTFFSVTGTIAVVGGLVFLGYRVAPPILAYINGADTASSVTDEPLDPIALTETTETTTSAPVEVTTTTTTVTTTQPAANIAVNGQAYVGYYLDDKDLESAEALDAALAKVEAGSSVILPLKLTGGALSYRSEVEGAKRCGAASDAALTLREITDALEAKKLTAIAKLSVLSDSLYPAYDETAGYFCAEDHTRWLDNKPEKDGKPWLSPFSESGVAYLQAITKELTEAGFNFVLCEDVEFPAFRDSDRKHLGNQVTNQESRILGLTGVLNSINTTAMEHGATAMLEFSMYDALNRDVEVLQPAQLSVPNAAVYIDMHSFRDTFWYGNEKYNLIDKSVTEVLNTVLPIAESMTGEMAVVPCFKRSSLSDAEYTQVCEVMKSMGYTRYMFR